MESSGLAARHLLQRNRSRNGTEEDSVVIRIRDGPVVTLGEWVACEEPVILTGMPSGDYEFQVRAIDLAGNTGEPTSVSAFSVDETLPIPGEDTGGDSGSDLSISQPIALALMTAGGVVFVLLMCVVVGCWRRRSRRRRIEKINAQRNGLANTGLRRYRHEDMSASSTDPMLAAAMQVGMEYVCKLFDVCTGVST